jgi:hypothetical protein
MNADHLPGHLTVKSFDGPGRRGAPSFSWSGPRSPRDCRGSDRLRFQYVVLSRSVRGFASAASSRHCFAKASHGSRQDAFADFAASRSHSSARRKARSCLSFILLQRSEDDFVSGGRLSGPFRVREGGPEARPPAQARAKLPRLLIANRVVLQTLSEQFAGIRPHSAPGTFVSGVRAELNNDGFPSSSCDRGNKKRPAQSGQHAAVRWAMGIAGKNQRVAPRSSPTTGRMGSVGDAYDNAR